MKESASGTRQPDAKFPTTLVEEAELLSEEERVDMAAVLKSGEWIVAGDQFDRDYQVSDFTCK